MAVVRGRYKRNRHILGGPLSEVEVQTLQEMSRHHRLRPYSRELNLIEILWRRAKYHWREFVTWAAKVLRKEVQVLFEGFGTKFNFSYA